MSVGLVVPICNPGPLWDRWLEGYAAQSVSPDAFVVMDSSSGGEAADKATLMGARVIEVAAGSFDHGGTRQSGVECLPPVDYVIVMSQDALLADRFGFERLLAPLSHDLVGASFGRQLPRRSAGPIEAYSRLFSYPAAGRVTSLEDASSLGVRAAFLSNAFAGYRMSALRSVGGFPDGTIFGEDAIVGGRLLLNGWRIAYAAHACVLHSHSYSVAMEGRRYFDIGVMHSDTRWPGRRLGSASNEGLRYVRGEMKYLLHRAPARVPEALIRTCVKWSMYQFGLRSNSVPRRVSSIVSLNRAYWS